MVQMMKTQLDMIEADLKVLQSEFKKKNPQIKESVEIALTWLQQAKQQQSQGSSGNIQSQQPIELLEPLRLMFDQKIAKTYPMAMNLLQKITQMFQVFEHQTLLLILAILKDASSEFLDEMTEIRILQMLLTFLDPHTIQLSKEFTQLVMQCCFQMMDTKSLAVKSTIQATLKQLFTIILERFVDGCKEAIPATKQRDIFTAKKHGVQFTQEEVIEITDLLRAQFQGGDSISLIVGEIVQSLAFTVLMFEHRPSKSKAPAQQAASTEALCFKSSPYSRCVVLDLINLCLTMTNELFRFFPEILSILELQIAPTIEPLLQQKVAQSSIGMRLMKCATLIINNLGVSIQLLRTILSDAETMTTRSRDGSISVNLNWRCLIAFECLQIVISNPGLSELFANSSLSIGAPVLIQILECYIQAAKAIEQSSDPLINSMTGQLASGIQDRRHTHHSGRNQVYQSSSKISKVIDSQNLEGEINPPTFLQIQRIIIESICTFSDNFVYVFSAIGIKLGTPSEGRGKNRDTEESPSLIKCKKMLTLCWKPLLETLQKLIRTTPDESNIHMLLKAFRSCIGACGSANCYEARDAFLQALCNECITVSNTGSQASSTMSGGLSASYRDQQSGRKSLAGINVKPSAPGEDQMTITERNVLICKTFFNIAHCLCHVLDVKSWFLILETMQKIETVIHKKLQVHGLVQRKDRPAFNQDGNQLIINFEELKKKVEDKMVRFNIVERSQNQALKRPGHHHSRLSISGGNQITSASRPSFSMLNANGNGVMSPERDDDETSTHQIQLPALSVTADRISIQTQYRGNQNASGNPFEEIRDLNSSVASNARSQASVDPLIADLHMLQESFDSLFTSTLLFDMQSLAELICALAQLTVGVLENFNSPMFSTQLGARTSTESEILQQINTFAMSRLVETALVNVSRIDNFWKIIVAHFDILSNCQVLAIRQLTIEALQTIVLSIFGHKKTLQIAQQVVAQPDHQLNRMRSTTTVIREGTVIAGMTQMEPEIILHKVVSVSEHESAKSIKQDLLSRNRLGSEDVAPEDVSEIDGRDVDATSGQASSSNTSMQSMEESKSGRKQRSGRSGRGGDESWQNSTWQYTVLVPLAEQLKSNHNSDKLSVIKGFEKIIQTCGQQIKNEGWRIIIVTISKSLEHESDQVVACGFRCLKLVVSNYINRLSQQNFVTVLNAIHMYASNSGSNINNNLIAIGMFQNVADYAAKQITKDNSGADPNLSVAQLKVNAINFEKIWEILFERIFSLGSNKRAEVRKTTVHTLENIIMTHGAALQIGQNVWPKVLNETVLGMLKNCVERYAQSTNAAALAAAGNGAGEAFGRDSNLDPVSVFGGGPAKQQSFGAQIGDIVAPTPTFFGSGGAVSQTQGKAQPKMQFDDATVTKALKQNDSQWEETCTVLVQTSCRSLKKYFQVTKEKSSGANQAQVWEMAQEFWSELTNNMNLMLSVGSSEVCILIFKALLNFLGDADCQKLFLQCEDESRTFLSAVIDYLVVEQDNFQAQKIDRNKTIKLLKICPIVIETLQKLYNKQSLDKLQELCGSNPQAASEDEKIIIKIIDKEFCQIVMQLLEMVVCTSKAAESLQSFGTNKLLSEERTVFDFIESLNDFYALSVETQEAYLDFLFRFTEYRSEQQRQEAFIKRSFSIFYGIILRGTLQKTIVPTLIPRLVDRMRDLINLRYDNQACVTLIFQAKGQQPLFLTVGLYFIHIASFLINPEQYKARLQLHGDKVSETRIGGGQLPAEDKKSEAGLEKGGTGSQAREQQQVNSAASSTKVSPQSMMLAPGSGADRDLLFSETIEFQPGQPAQVRPEEYTNVDTRQLVWERVIELLQTSLLFDVNKVADHNKAVLQEVVKASQELDMQVMNFILNCLLPNSVLQGQSSSETQKVLEQSLVHIIDKGCTNQTIGGSLASQIPFTTATGASVTLSRYCFNNMFELCRCQEPLALLQSIRTQTANGEQEPQIQTGLDLQQSEAQKSINEIKLKIARIATPILINRCKQTLKKFIKDEKKVGSQGMSKSRIAEVVFILDKLRDLDCYSQFQQQKSAQQQPQQQLNLIGGPTATGGNFKKGHLIELMPILSDLILRNEQGVKDSLRLCFLEISTALSENMLAVQEAYAQQQQDFMAAAGSTDNIFENRVSTGAAGGGNSGSSGGDDGD